MILSKMIINLTTSSVFILGFVLTFLASCSRKSPAGFWTDYKENYILKNINDQGPYGGHRSMFWQADKKNTFTSSELIDFASKNGWQLTDSTTFPVDTVKAWKNVGLTFPFTYSDFTDKTMSTSIFPRWITSDIRLYRFKTGWIAIEPGNARETQNNGYVVLNSDGTQLSVYHLWGE